jgi:hypothetical protein
MTMHPDQSRLDQSKSNKSLSRPGSAYVFFGGERHLLKKAKSRIGLRDARSRDIVSKKSHNYMAKANKFTLSKVKDASLAYHVKVPELPEII